MNHVNAFDWVMAAVLAIGGVLLGLIGFFQYDLLAEMFGAASATTRTIQSAIGLAVAAEIVALIIKAARPHALSTGRQPAHT